MSLAISSHPNASANTNYFLPRNVFFHCTLTTSAATEIATGALKQCVFSYSLYGAEFGGAFCGYAGYSHEWILAVDDPFVAKLENAYSNIKLTYEHEWRETRADEFGEQVESTLIHVFFYRADYDFIKFRVALRYNENWDGQVVRFGRPRAVAELCCSISGKESIAASWPDSNLVLPQASSLSNHWWSPMR